MPVSTDYNVLLLRCMSASRNGKGLKHPAIYIGLASVVGSPVFHLKHFQAYPFLHIVTTRQVELRQILYLNNAFSRDCSSFKIWGNYCTHLALITAQREATRCSISRNSSTIGSRIQGPPLFYTRYGHPILDCKPTCRDPFCIPRPFYFRHYLHYRRWGFHRTLTNLNRR